MQGMLIQGPAPDPKRKLDISSFLTLTHPSIFREFFDILKSMKFGNLVGLLSSPRQFDRVYQTLFVLDFLEAIFQRQAPR